MIDISAKAILPLKLRRARLEAGLTQEQLAEALDVTAKTIQDWERTRGSATTRVPRLERLDELGEALGRPAWWFLYPEPILESVDEVRTLAAAMVQTSGMIQRAAGYLRSAQIGVDMHLLRLLRSGRRIPRWEKLDKFTNHRQEENDRQIEDS